MRKRLALERETMELIMSTGTRKIVVYAHQLHPDFFDLSTRLTGEVFQKLTASLRETLQRFSRA